MHLAHAEEAHCAGLCRARLGEPCAPRRRAHRARHGAALLRSATPAAARRAAVVRLASVSDLNDPRVLFAAERTLLAWNRTASGLIALGFFIDPASLMTDPSTALFATVIGLAFILLGVVLNVLSVVQYRRSVAALRAVEIPPGYWPNLSVVTSLIVSLLGLLLALYVLSTL